MKFLITATFVLGLAAGIGASGGTFSTKDLVTQQCGPGNKAAIVFFKDIRVPHPLGENTCGKGNLHTVDGIDLAGNK